MTIKTILGPVAFSQSPLLRSPRSGTEVVVTESRAQPGIRPWRRAFEFLTSLASRVRRRLRISQRLLKAGGDGFPF